MDVWLCDVVIGSFAGILGTISGHPFDTIKVEFEFLKNLSVDCKQTLRSFLQFLSQ